MIDNKERIKVSLIIPVYNAEKYIDKCLDSIMSQTYKNIEIICVNDGSKDKSKDIIEEYLKKDNRIRLINQTNSGGIIARKTGFEESTGDFCIIMDADDWIELNTVETLINKTLEYKKRNIDIEFIKFRFVGEPSKMQQKKYQEKNEFLYEGEYLTNVLSNMIKDPSYNNIWNVFFNRRLLDFNDDIFKHIVHKAEDLQINLSILYKVKNILLINDVLYHYLNNPKGITRSINIEIAKRNIKDYLYLLEERISFTNAKNLNIEKKDIQNILLTGISSEISKLMSSKKMKKSEFILLNNYLKEIDIYSSIKGYSIKEFKHSFVKKIIIKNIIANKVDKLYYLYVLIKFFI